MSLKIVELSDNNRWDKIRPEEDWSLVLADKTILFNAICNLLLNSENLFYYASQKSTCMNLEDCREYIRRLIKDGTIATRLAPVLSALGWTSDELDTSSTVLAGDIGEYLMAILVDKFLPIRTIVCKVSLKTSSSMPSFLNDGIFYDYKNKTLFFGEAKFYSKLEEAYQEARSSLQNHIDSFEELSYIRSHDNLIISENNERRLELQETFETISNKDVVIKQIAFLINDDIYKKDDYVKFLNSRRRPLSSDVIIVVLPILSKKEFLDYFAKELKKYEQ